MTITTSDISFELPEGEREKIEQMKLGPDVEGGEGEEEEVATDVPAFSAWNCAWIPPVTRDKQ